MKIDIQARGFSLTGALSREIQKRVTFPLSKRHDQINGITVRLGDINGPRGGQDKYCCIKVEMHGQKDVYVENVESDMYVAISRAAERVSRTVTRRIERLREHAARHRGRKADLTLAAQTW